MMPEPQKRIEVRTIRPTDYDEIVEVQRACFPGMTPWTREQFESQLKIFPEGQICVAYDGRVVASSSSLIIDFDIYHGRHTWHEIADRGFIRNHNPDGDTLYGIEIMVHPDFRSMKLARRLYDARKELAIERNLQKIVIGGRIPGYSAYRDEMSVREYVDKVVRRELVDPVLTMQLSNGFVLKRLISDYLRSDQDSQGYAALLEWSNLDYKPAENIRFVATSPVRICLVQYQMREVKRFEDFAQQCEYFVDVASDYKADFVLFPELFSLQLLSFMRAKEPGTAARELAKLTPKLVKTFSDLSIRFNVNIIGGSHFTVEDEHLYNVAYLFRRDGSMGRQYKLHVTPNERRWWGVEPGSEIVILDTDRGKVSIQICYDIEFPEISRIAVDRGAQLIFVPFCTDERYAYLRVRYCAQARCIENHVYAAIAGTVGNLPFVPNADIQYAQSGIFTPSDIPFTRDAIASECTPNIEMVVIEDVDLELLKRHRQTGSVLNWKDRRQDLYEVRHSGPGGQKAA